ncbi:hypothetical protein [Desulfosporosinus youngiae]|uniref:Uncharacterized protein n=1 Tax=Desulfosporosinus youngiae DSM 17734 TaxID=768710 RepID=H5XZR4_9FIRM|nr:hypothetical protein [Desulfosporosinus youngiae]EHQ92110.1 hypothetical protein DesyoDRAFT_5179 [Desulfosporosinus youngiae DSM 17734]
MKSIKLCDYIAIVKPSYVYLKLTPNNSIRNNTSNNLAKTIGSLYKTFHQSIKIEHKKLIKLFGKKFVLGSKYSLILNPKVSYYIYIEKKRIEFYFIVPEQSQSIIKEKMTDSWNNVTVQAVNELPGFNEDVTTYQLDYSKEDGLSLAVDKRSNSLLESNLNIVDIMHEGDKVGIFYNFIPTSQRSWLSEYKATITKVRKEQPVDKNKTGIIYLFKLAFSLLSGLVDDVGGFLGDDSRQKYLVRYEKNNASILEQTLRSAINHKVVSNATVTKGKHMVLNIQAIVLSESKDDLHQRNNAIALAQSYDCIGEDNSLRHRKYKGKFHHLDTKIKGAATMKVSVYECGNFLALPGRELLEKHKFIEKVETLETEVPDELLKGVMCLGENTYKGYTQKVYMSTDFDYQMLSLVLIGPNRAGKSKFLANIARDAIEAGECVIIPDYIGSCQLSEEIATTFPRDKVLEIRCDHWDTLQGLGYNEVPRSTTHFIQYKNAKEQSALLMTLVDSINADDANFTAKMGRYFESAALAVFLSNGNIKDVFATLINYKVRKSFIDRIPAEQMENMEEYIDYLHELDNVEKGKVVGTKMHLITGAVDRLQKLKVNAYIETMLKKGTENNIDLVKEMQKNQLIVIKMPQRMFLTDNEKDVYVTYWLTKIWLALQIREEQIQDRRKMTKVNLIIDELYQVNNAEKFLKLKLSQLPKFNLKPIISCHYLNQVKTIREEFRSANASYMLISGCDKKNYDELKSELYPYTEEDLLSLKRFHSLNLMKCNEGYAKFITSLPAPIS